MSIANFEPDKKYSFADYLKWNDNERWELIDGVPYNMTPAPSTEHQRLSRRLLVEFDLYLHGKACEVFSAPFDVRLSDSEIDEEIKNVVQPDISVICDPFKIDKKGCKGAPDLIIEILSPGTSSKFDKLYKFNLYQNYGVKEYWIVDPQNRNIEVFALIEGKYLERQVYTKEDTVHVGIFEDFYLNLSSIFTE